jgi:antitoxin MazE
MRVAKWGNSLAIRLPAALVEQLGLQEGDEVKLKGVDKLALEVERTRSRAELVEQLHKYHGLIGKDIMFDRDEANAR